MVQEMLGAEQIKICDWFSIKFVWEKIKELYNTNKIEVNDSKFFYQQLLTFLGK